MTPTPDVLDRVAALRGRLALLGPRMAMTPRRTLPHVLLLRLHRQLQQAEAYSAPGSGGELRTLVVQDAVREANALCGELERLLTEVGAP